jgi:hypothetical protein
MGCLPMSSWSVVQSTLDDAAHHLMHCKAPPTLGLRFALSLTELLLGGCLLCAGGVEPAFVLLSCAGTKRPNLSAEDQARVLAAKRRGEEQLRTSGLGYAIIRPGPLVDEPGGYKALVFDQGDRVTQSVSYADVADICLRTLREPEVRGQ